MDNLEGANEQFKTFGLPDPPLSWLPSIWRFSFWDRRRIIRSINLAIASEVCPASAKAAKDCLKQVNDAVFFMPDMSDKIETLINVHFSHQQLGSSAAYEIETKQIELKRPPRTDTFERALFDGAHFPVQACLYVEHRARLYIMKSLVDYWLSKMRGELAERNKWVLRVGGKKVAFQPVGITAAMQTSLARLSTAKKLQAVSGSMANLCLQSGADSPSPAE